jgi:hypothetical protein
MARLSSIKLLQRSSLALIPSMHLSGWSAPYGMNRIINNDQQFYEYAFNTGYRVSYPHAMTCSFRLSNATLTCESPSQWNDLITLAVLLPERPLYDSPSLTILNYSLRSVPL